MGTFLILRILWTCEGSLGKASKRERERAVFQGPLHHWRFCFGFFPFAVLCPWPFLFYFIFFFFFLFFVVLEVY